MKKALSALLAVFVALSAGGCSPVNIWADYRETEDLELIRVLGVDSADQSVTVTAGTGEWADGEESRIIMQRAENLPAALNCLRCDPVGREPCFTHTEYLVVGEELAREGLGGLLDYVERMSTLRLKTGLFIVRGGSAESAISACAGERSSAADMLKYISANVELMGLGSVYSCGSVAASLADDGLALVQAVAVGGSGGTEGDFILKPLGYAAFRDGKLLCYFEGAEAAALSVLTGRVKSMGMSAEPEDGSRAVMELRGFHVRVSPRWEEAGLAAVRVDIEAKAGLTQMSGGADIEAKAVRRALERRLAGQLEELTERTIVRTQALGCDFAGLGGMLDRRCPGKFASVRVDWASIYPNLDITVSARVELDRTFEITSTPASAVYGDERGNVDAVR
ncbi:MAG: hypothetical protein IJG63_06030 [Oscillospiraceae bacterium]|nr:hypothetical protein [Oscillospiraceae bacterium]